MPNTIRIASFNVENLFSRARVLNLQDHEKAAVLLDEIATLNSLIGKKLYTASDKRDIARLIKKLSRYTEIREDRSKLYRKDKQGRIQVTAKGASSWDGEIELLRANFSEQARESTAQAIRSLRANILCLVEAESRPGILDFNDSYLKGTSHFRHAMLIDGNDRRGIDVGLFSEFPIRSIRSHVDDMSGSKHTFSRDCPEYAIELPNGRILTILCNHLKSQGYGDKKVNDARRKIQASRVAEILQRYDLQKEYVVVAGDMNDTPDSAPLAPLLNTPDLHDVLELQFGQDRSKRWTYKFKKELNQIDFILVSKPLKDRFRGAAVERRGMYGVQSITGMAPFPTVTKPSMAASDHGGVVAEFSL